MQTLLSNGKRRDQFAGTEKILKLFANAACQLLQIWRNVDIFIYWTAQMTAAQPGGFLLSNTNTVKNFKIIILFYFSFVLAVAARAQQSKNTFVGIFGGYNHSSVGGTLVEKDREFNSMFRVSGKQEGGDGFLLYAAMKHQFNNLVYLKYGLGYFQKQVKPMENSYELYKDTLKTGYIFLPVLAGLTLPLNSAVSVNIECGPAVNFKAVDKTITGPDRAGFKTKSTVISAVAGAGISIQTNKKTIVSFNYQYVSDLTEAYIEYLYWNSAEPHKPFNYKYKTHTATIGLQWAL